MDNFLKRFQEPSSYASIAVALAVFFPGIEDWAGTNYVTEFGVALSALAAFVMKEKGK